MRRRILAVAVLGAAGLLPMLGSELTVYRCGVVLIFFVATIGLHLLVNWAGQLSLATAVMVGLPALSVLAISDVHGISPVYLLFPAVLIGAVVGVVVALPVLRARDLQVALGTLVAGIGLERFFYRQDWLAGPPGGRATALPTLGPFEFTTSRSLYPLLLSVIAIAVVAAWVLMHSKLGRAWFWLKTDPSAASAFGIPVTVYLVGAYALAGAFAGLSGGLFVMWVQQLGPEAFPFALSFSYLLMVVLGGPGFLGGTALAVLLLQGGTQLGSAMGADVGKTVDTFVTYGGPVALILTLGRVQGGLNGMGRSIMQHVRARIAPRRPAPASRNTKQTSTVDQPSLVQPDPNGADGESPVAFEFQTAGLRHRAFEAFPPAPASERAKRR